MSEPPSESPSAGRLFGTVADLYDDTRPGYPAELYDAIEHVTGPIEGRRVLDLAAGTGLQSRALAGRGARILAVDPDLGMLGRLRSRAPNIPVVAGRAEQIPVRDGEVDLVACATAWHWLNTTDALAEIRRVLRPSGYLILWWANHRWGEGIAWEDAQDAVLDRWDTVRGSVPPSHGGVGPREAAADLRARGLDVVLDQEFNWSREVTREQHLQVLATHSNQLVLPAEDRQQLLAEIEAALQPWPSMSERLWGPLIIARV
jgi:SAM-dependent methyltransferase